MSARERAEFVMCIMPDRLRHICPTCKIVTVFNLFSFALGTETTTAQAQGNFLLTVIIDFRSESCLTIKLIGKFTEQYFAVMLQVYVECFFMFGSVDQVLQFDYSIKGISNTTLFIYMYIFVKKN